jgi:AcrR family transcriptional regulator
MSDPDGDTPRQRTPRHEGRQNVLRATLELLAERDPDQITVRDIAERSGHHHRFVQEWFGGKSNLFAEAFKEMSLELAERLDFNRPTNQVPDPMTVRVIRLMNWLVSNDPAAMKGDRLRPVMNRLQHMYEDRFGIAPETAVLLAQRMMFVMSGMVLFKDVVAAGELELARQVVLEFEIARLLGTRPG